MNSVASLLETLEPHSAAENGISAALGGMANLLHMLPLNTADARAVAARSIVYHSGMLAGVKACGLITSDQYSKACELLRMIANEFLATHCPTYRIAPQVETLQ